MKNLVPLTLALVAFALPAAAQPSPVGTATLTLSMGTITYADVFTPVPDGSLVQLVINFSGTTFAAPTAVDFLGGSADCAILWQGAFDSTTAGTPGSMVTIIPPLKSMRMAHRAITPLQVTPSSSAGSRP